MNIQPTNYNTPSFGFNVKVNYEGCLTEAEKSDFFFKKADRIRLEKILPSAKKIHPEKTVTFDLKMVKFPPFPLYDADIFVDGTKMLTTKKNDSGTILAFITRLSNPYSRTYTDAFGKSKENIDRAKKISATFHRTA